EMRAAGPRIASLVNQLGYDLHGLSLELDGLEIQGRSNDLLLEKERAGQIGNCATATAAGVGGLVDKTVAGAFTAVATCINSAIQIGFLEDLGDLQDEALLNDQYQTLNRYQDRFEERALSLERIATGLATTRENLDAAIARVQNLRLQAQRSL